jgi:hypothetical protein
LALLTAASEFPSGDALRFRMPLLFHTDIVISLAPQNGASCGFSADPPPPPTGSVIQKLSRKKKKS